MNKEKCIDVLACLAEDVKYYMEGKDGERPFAHEIALCEKLGIEWSKERICALYADALEIAEEEHKKIFPPKIASHLVEGEEREVSIEEEQLFAIRQMKSLSLHSDMITDFWRDRGQRVLERGKKEPDTASFLTALSEITKKPAGEAWRWFDSFRTQEALSVVVQAMKGDDPKFGTGTVERGY